MTELGPRTAVLAQGPHDLPGRRVWAVLYGIACHASFAAAIVAMGFGLFDGMQHGFGRLRGIAGLSVDLLLVLQFPLLHSLLLTRAGGRALARLAPRGLGRDLAPTTYATIASLQILLTFVVWSPTGIVWFEPDGPLRWVSGAAFAAAWLFLALAIADGGLGLQTGSIGWTAVWRGRAVDYGPFPQGGLFARCRQPIYLGFLATLWTGPVWTPDHLLIAGLWSGYCVLGPYHKERRYERIHGEAFADYRCRVPYMVPKVFR